MKQEETAQDMVQHGLQEARRALEAGNGKAARDLLRTALEVAPAEPSLHLAYALALRAVGDWGEARAACEKAVRMAPMTAAYHLAMGDILWKMNVVALARQHYLVAVNLAPEEPLGHLKAGQIALWLDEIPEAEAFLQTALQIAPEDPLVRNLELRLTCWKEVKDCSARNLPTQAGEALRKMLGLEEGDSRLFSLQLLNTMSRGKDVRLMELYTSTIGGLAGNTEVYLAECEAGLHGDKLFNIFITTPPICNGHLLKMWERTLCVLPAAKSVLALWNRVPSPRHGLPDSGFMRPWGDRDPMGLLHGTQPQLSFTAEELALGQATLERMGVPKGHPFICFHARDEAYLNGDSHRKRDPDYHEYRNSNITWMLPAMEAMHGRGYTAIRMGAHQEKPVPTSCPGIIDYAKNGFRTEFMDIFLLANCAFYMGGTSGTCIVPEIFRHPVAFVNFVPIDHLRSWNPTPLIFKKHYLEAEQRYLSLAEIFQRGAGAFLETALFKQAGIRLEENTAEEILALAIEVDERGKGIWVTTAEDERLQDRFWEVFKRHASPTLHGIYRARIGAAFLRSYAGLLE